jgi:YidC/Oxa1 family membrane protein insertase
MIATEQIRLILIVALCVVSFLLWDAWQRDYGPKPPPPPASTGQTVPDTASGGPASPGADVPRAPEAAPAERTAAPSSDAEADQPVRGRKVRVTTDVLAVDIDTVGGTIAGVDLRSYPVSNDKPDEPFRLLDDTDPRRYFIAQSGLTGAPSAPNHHSRFESAADTYELADGADFVDVPLRWRSDHGVEVVRTYRFRRDDYLVDVRTDVVNRSEEAWNVAPYAQLQRGEPESEGGIFRTYTYTGGILSGPEKPYEKVDFSDMESQDVDRDVVGGWVAMIQHYFAAAWIPGSEDTNHYYSKSLPYGRFAIGVVGPVATVSPGSTGEFTLSLYVGPKIQERMQDVAPHLERTVDYGWLWLIAEPLFWLLSWIHGFVGNYGWSIILLTVLINIVIFPLRHKSVVSMRKMQELQPEMKAIQARYSGLKATDPARQKMNQEVMELYRRHGANPASGCLPMLMTMPILIAFYRLLSMAVELRGAPFMGWIDDLSVQDPFYVTPLIMGASMVYQQRLQPAGAASPEQQRIMTLMPVLFTVMFLWAPSGLVIYWLTSNLLGIGQTVVTNRIAGPPRVKQVRPPAERQVKKAAAEPPAAEPPAPEPPREGGGDRQGRGRSGSKAGRAGRGSRRSRGKGR